MPRRYNNYRPDRCRIIRHTGIPCDRPIAVGNRYTCLKHERNEPRFDSPRLCQVCEDPLPATRPGDAKVCQTGKCRNHRRNRRLAEQAGQEYAPRSPRCTGCGTGTRATAAANVS